MQFGGIQQRIDQFGLALDLGWRYRTEDFLRSIYRLEVLRRRHHIDIAFDVLAYLVGFQTSDWAFNQQHCTIRLNGVGD